jgi:hypothetical protein
MGCCQRSRVVRSVGKEEQSKRWMVAGWGRGFDRIDSVLVGLEFGTVA